MREKLTKPVAVNNEIKYNIEYDIKLLTPVNSFKIKTITSFYTGRDNKRDIEIRECITRNSYNFLEQHIVCENFNDYNIAKGICQTAIVHLVNKRPKFSDMINLIQENSDENTIFILMNSDIILTDSILLLKYIDLTDTAIALKRWEIKGDFLYMNTELKDSQDIWCWTKKITSPIGDYYMGIRGCDNRFAYELYQNFSNVIDVPHDIITVHNHVSGIRATTYNKDVVGPPYRFPLPKILVYNKSYPVHETYFYNKNVLVVAFKDQLINESFKALKANSNFIDCEISTLEQDVAVYLSRNKIDIIFFQKHSGYFSNNFLEYLRSYPAYKINWTGDVRAPIPDWYKNVSKGFDITLFSNETDPEDFRNLGYKSDFLNIGYDTNKFIPYGTRIKSEFDIVFLANSYTPKGTIFPNLSMREDMVNLLKNKFGEKFGLFGFGWSKYYARVTKNYEEESMIYRSSKIGISLSNFNHKRYFSDRMLRLMGSGCLCLTKNYPDLEKDFKDGENVVVWNTLEELLEKIYFYLNNPLERIRIAKNGYELVSSNHTWINRLIDLKDIMLKYPK